jgi:hypothetical protein
LIARVLIVLMLGSVADARAQSAWVPVKDEGAVTVTFQALNFAGHFDPDGNKIVGAVPSRSFLGIAEFEYGLTDKLAFAARLPYIASRFTGDEHEPITTLLRERYKFFRDTHPHAEVTNLDTGDYYATFQDFNFSFRYNLIERAVVITPGIGVTLPSHDYHTVGDAAPGQNRRALNTGVNVGMLLDPFLPRAYVHARYTYSFVERLLGVSLDRSTADLEVGYAIRPTISVRGLVAWLRTHGGVSFFDAYEDVELFLEHDRLLAGRHLHYGAGATVSLTDSMDLDGAVVNFFRGSDTHYGLGATVGLSWRFYRGGAPASPALTQRRP